MYWKGITHGPLLFFPRQESFRLYVGLQIKRKSDGSIECYKARLMILDNTQVEGLDYHETFAPIAKTVIVRMLLAVTASRN